ncbi:MAG: AglZ/HisF2 family acetamidino modification protein [Bacteroidetes bacterium]|nr:AglZ/HisF2 family acetamidino modification protein [Bacteroidota bacterium]
MILPRIIPTLLLYDEGIVKTKSFKNPVYLGDPINAVRIFNEKEVDELVIADIAVTKNGGDPNFKWIEEIVSEAFMPIGYAGGISNLDTIKMLFNLGIEKVILNSFSFDYDLITEAAKIYGNQSIVVCIDVKKTILGNYKIYTHSGQQKQSTELLMHAKKVVEAGAGEIIIQSIDKEGAMSGYDITLTRNVADSVDVPIVALGGASCMKDMEEVIKQGGASAAAAGSIFVFKSKERGVLINYPSKTEIANLFMNE